MREPFSRFSARVLNVVPTSAAVPSISRGVMVSRLPAIELDGLVILELACADLGALQIGEDADGLLFPRGRRCGPCG